MGQYEPTCDVPDCTKESFVGWNPEQQMKRGLKVCIYHWNKHCDTKDSFSLWDVVGASKPEKVTIPKGETEVAKKKKTKKKKAVKKTTTRPVGKTSKLGVLATWAKMFIENEKKHLTDAQILAKMKLEFPGQAAKSKIFSNVKAHRRFYNKGGILPGPRPKTKSKEYEPKKK